MSKEQITSNSPDVCLVLTEQKLYQFSQTSLVHFSKKSLDGSSTSATVICAFLIGAANTFASDSDALQLTIAELLDLDDRGTEHLIKTTRRLVKKYSFVGEVLKQGQQSAAAWLESDGHTEATTLAELINQSKDLTLADLKKLTITSGQRAPSARATVNRAVEANPRLKRLLFILLALIILVTANYLTLTIL